MVKCIDREILRKSFAAFPGECRDVLNSADLHRQMLTSKNPVIQAIIRNDVSAFSTLCMDNPNFEVEIGGRIESALTLACIANAVACANSMLLRGVVPRDAALAGAVRSQNTALMRKMDNAVGDKVTRFLAYQTALLMEMPNVASFFERKSPELIAWHNVAISRVSNQCSLSAAWAIADRAILGTVPDFLVLSQIDFGAEHLATERVTQRVLAGRSAESIKRVVLLGSWTGWEREEPAAATMWPNLESIDLSGSHAGFMGE
jgi:hypothetical protein